VGRGATPYLSPSRLVPRPLYPFIWQTVYIFHRLEILFARSVAKLSRFEIFMNGSPGGPAITVPPAGRTKERGGGRRRGGEGEGGWRGGGEGVTSQRDATRRDATRLNARAAICVQVQVLSRQQLDVTYLGETARSLTASSTPV